MVVFCSSLYWKLGFLFLLENDLFFKFLLENDLLGFQVQKLRPKNNNICN